MARICGSTDTVDGERCQNPADSCPINHRGGKTSSQTSSDTAESASQKATAPLSGTPNLAGPPAPLGVGSTSSGLAGSPTEFASLLNKTHAALGLSEESIVQNYWLTACLHNLAKAGSPHGMKVFREINNKREPNAILAFTGGTSLVSAWNITERFSEDLDLLAVDLSGGSTKGAQRKARSDFSEWFKEPLGGSDLPVNRDDNRKKGYRKISLPVGNQSGVLKVEIASEEVREDILEHHPVSSLMGRFASDTQLAQFPELGRFELLCTNPAYTAANKFDALHRRSVKGHFRGLGLRIRDLYDLAMIADSDYADDARRLIPDLAERAMSSFGRSDDAVPRPVDGYANSIMFTRGSEAQDALRNAYPSLANFVWGDLPSFDDAIAMAVTLDGN